MNKLEKMLEKPITNLARNNRRPPNREALILYRQYIKFFSYFEWCDNDGTPWNKLLPKAVRGEFEAARDEKDPVILSQLLITGRQALDKLKKKYMAAQSDFVEHIKNTRTDHNQREP
jgi:hypothetical protein